MNLRHFYVEWKLWKIIETERRYELETISPNTLLLLTNSKITAISSSGSIVNTSNLRFVSIRINLNCFLKSQICILGGILGYAKFF